MVTIPAEISYGHVVGRFIKAIDDSADVDRYPDGTPIAGTVTFTPTVPLVVATTATPPTTVFLEQITCSLDSDGFIIDSQGAQGVYLVATDDPDVEPTTWTWAATFDFGTDTLLGFTFNLPSCG